MEEPLIAVQDIFDNNNNPLQVQKHKRLKKLNTQFEDQQFDNQSPEKQQQQIGLANQKDQSTITKKFQLKMNSSENEDVSDFTHQKQEQTDKINSDDLSEKHQPPLQQQKKNQKRKIIPIIIEDDDKKKQLRKNQIKDTSSDFEQISIHDGIDEEEKENSRNQENNQQKQQKPQQQQQSRRLKKNNKMYYNDQNDTAININEEDQENNNQKVIRKEIDKDDEDFVSLDTAEEMALAKKQKKQNKKEPKKIEKNKDILNRLKQNPLFNQEESDEEINESKADRINFSLMQLEKGEQRRQRNGQSAKNNGNGNSNIITAGMIKTNNKLFGAFNSNNPLPEIEECPPVEEEYIGNEDLLLEKKPKQKKELHNFFNRINQEKQVLGLLSANKNDNNMFDEIDNNNNANIVSSVLEGTNQISSSAVNNNNNNNINDPNNIAQNLSMPDMQQQQYQYQSSEEIRIPMDLTQSQNISVSQLYMLQKQESSGTVQQDQPATSSSMQNQQQNIIVGGSQVTNSQLQQLQQFNIPMNLKRVNSNQSIASLQRQNSSEVMSKYMTSSMQQIDPNDQNCQLELDVLVPNIVGTNSITNNTLFINKLSRNFCSSSQGLLKNREFTFGEASQESEGAGLKMAFNNSQSSFRQSSRNNFIKQVKEDIKMRKSRNLTLEDVSKRYQKTGFDQLQKDVKKQQYNNNKNEELEELDDEENAEQENSQKQQQPINLEENASSEPELSLVGSPEVQNKNNNVVSSSQKERNSNNEDDNNIELSGQEEDEDEQDEDLDSNNYQKLLDIENQNLKQKNSGENSNSMQQQNNNDQEEDEEELDEEEQAFFNQMKNRKQINTKAQSGDPENIMENQQQTSDNPNINNNNMLAHLLSDNHQNEGYQADSNSNKFGSQESHQLDEDFNKIIFKKLRKVALTIKEKQQKKEQERKLRQQKRQEREQRRKQMLQDPELQQHLQEMLEDEAEQGSDNEEHDDVVKQIDKKAELEEAGLAGMDLDADLEELINNEEQILNDDDEQNAYNKFMKDLLKKDKEHIKMIMEGAYKGARKRLTKIDFEENTEEDMMVRRFKRLEEMMQEQQNGEYDYGDDNTDQGERKKRNRNNKNKQNNNDEVDEEERQIELKVQLQKFKKDLKKHNSREIVNVQLVDQDIIDLVNQKQQTMVMNKQSNISNNNHSTSNNNSKIQNQNQQIFQNQLKPLNNNSSIIINGSSSSANNNNNLLKQEEKQKNSQQQQQHSNLNNYNNNLKEIISPMKSESLIEDSQKPLKRKIVPELVKPSSSLFNPKFTKNEQFTSKNSVLQLKYNKGLICMYNEQNNFGPSAVNNNNQNELSNSEVNSTFNKAANKDVENLSFKQFYVQENDANSNSKTMGNNNNNSNKNDKIQGVNYKTNFSGVMQKKATTTNNNANNVQGSSLNKLYGQNQQIANRPSPNKLILFGMRKNKN